MVANPAEDFLGLDFISQPDPSGNFKPGQGNWQFSRLIWSGAVASWAGATTKCQNGGATVGKQGSFYSQGLGLWRKFFEFCQ